MTVISKNILLFSFLGALYWICLQPERTEPYLVSFSILFVLLVVYTENCGAMPDLRITTLGLKKMKPDEMPALCYEIENVGDGDARNIQIETRINVTGKKHAGESFSVSISSRAPRMFLSQGRTMQKNLPFMKRLSAYEIRMVKKGELVLSAYSVVRYKNDRRKVHRELRACSVYNPDTQCFEKTFGLCAGEDWPNIEIQQPVNNSYASC